MKTRAIKTAKQTRARHRLFSMLEPLETRTLYTVTVDNVHDSGPGSLRQAILDANGALGAQTIAFAIPGSFGASHTISLSSALPALTNAITIDGTTQPGYSDRPLILIDGSVSAIAGNAISV